METRDSIRELYCFAAVRKIFTFNELQDFADPSLDPQTLLKGLIRDRRFIKAADERSGENLFILDSIFFQWLVKLNIRLARIPKFRLSEKQVACLFSILRATARFDHPPAAFIAWGQKMGLICQGWSGDHFVFPLAKVLSAMDERTKRMTTGIFDDLNENKVWNLDLEVRVGECIEKGLALIRPDVRLIITRREALSGRQKWTLQRLGDSFKLTRERIRQLEEKFWASLNYGFRMLPAFLEAFFCSYMSGRGSLIIDCKSPRASERIFLAKCAGIALTEFPIIGFKCMASRPEENILMKSQKGLSLILKGKILAGHLDSNTGVNYCREDIQAISERIIRQNRKRLSRVQRVYFALASIGKPAHFSNIASIHNLMWPDRVANENAIHAALSEQKLGVVWIGRKGIYALKEWGYERPSKTLFATVAEIVKNKHQEIGIPVNINLVSAELGKYRRHVNLQSLAIALSCNPLISCVGKDVYLPSETKELKRGEQDLEQIDRSLENYQKNKKRKR
jgi:hypothetical protein